MHEQAQQLSFEAGRPGLARRLLDGDHHVAEQAGVMLVREREGEHVGDAIHAAIGRVERAKLLVIREQDRPFGASAAGRPRLKALS
jgi:hypothetical protein